MEIAFRRTKQLRKKRCQVISIRMYQLAAEKFFALSQDEGQINFDYILGDHSFN
jgi:hypothetical protein